jgi:hypothetical protein
MRVIRSAQVNCDLIEVPGQNASTKLMLYRQRIVNCFSKGIHHALEDLASVLDKHRGHSPVIGGIAVIACRVFSVADRHPRPGSLDGALPENWLIRAIISIVKLVA